MVDDDRVFEVIAIEGHERHEHVATERQFALPCGSTIGDDLTFFDSLAFFDDWLLIQAGAFIEADEFSEQIFIGVVDQDAGGIDKSNHARTFSTNKHAGVLSDGFFHARCTHWRINAQQRHSLALHVGTHQCTVGIVVFEERNQCCGDRNSLTRRDINIFNILAGDSGQIALYASERIALAEMPFFICDDIRRSQNSFHFFVSTKVFMNAVDFAIFHHTVRGNQEAVLINIGIDRQRGDQADVGTFRRFNRTDSAIVRNMNVTHFEAGSFTIQTARSKGRQSAFVRQL